MPSPGARAPQAARERPAPRSGEHGARVVELDHLHGAVGGGVEAQTAQHALVEVPLDDLERPVFSLRVDVHGAGLGEPARELGVGGRGVVDLDRDERSVAPHAGDLSAIFARIISGISSIRSATAMPASASRAIFSEAVSSLPSTIVPAWPKLIPGISSMKRPAMNATIGRREWFAVTQRASSASMRPPGSV